MGYLSHSWAVPTGVDQRLLRKTDCALRWHGYRLYICIAFRRGFHMNLTVAVRALIAALLLLPCAGGARAEREALLIPIDGAIGAATGERVARGIDEAESQGAELLILRLDTPGGLDKAMRRIIKAILASSVPEVSFVAPPGSRAASAGTYILYASHVAVMAPAYWRMHLPSQWGGCYPLHTFRNAPPRNINRGRL
jgi:hypothetical protein